MKFPLHGKAILHALGHVGLGALAVGAVVWPVLPPPFNLAVLGAAVTGNVILGYHGAKQVEVTPPTTK